MAQPIEQVTFKHSVELPQNLGWNTVARVHDGLKLAVDYARGVVILDDHKEYPLVNVLEIRRVPLPAGVELAESAHACDVCREEFNSAQALGAHRWRAHNIKGSSRGGDE